MGEGPALIVLHGLFGSLDNWMSIGKKWAEEYTVYLLDQRNHGQSPHHEEMNYSVMANDLFQFIEEHKIQNPILLGHSMGGKTVMELAVMHPEIPKKIIVVDIAPVAYEVHHYGILEALNAIDLNQISSRKEAEEIMQEKISEFGVRQFLLKNLYWEKPDQLNWRFNLKVIEEAIVPISNWAISEKQYTGPCLFIKGENSNYIISAYASAMANKFPNYELSEIANAGHWVHAEARTEFMELINNFMKH